MLHSRIERVQSLLQSEIGQILDQKLCNPKIPPFVTVWGVKVSKDLSQALVLITFLEDQSPDAIKETVAELNRSVGYVSRLLAGRIQLKRHPQLRFAYNPSTKFALDMEKFFHEIERERSAADREQAAEDETGGAEEERNDDANGR